MSRWFAPLFLLAVAGGVGWYNATHAGSKVVMWGFDEVWKNDPVRQGNATVALFVSLALLNIGVAGIQWGWSRLGGEGVDD